MEYLSDHALAKWRKRNHLDEKENVSLKEKNHPRTEENYKQQDVDYTEQLETMKVPQAKSNRQSAYARFREIQQQILQELKTDMESEMKLAGCTMFQTVKKQYARAASSQRLYLRGLSSKRAESAVKPETLLQQGFSI